MAMGIWLPGGGGADLDVVTAGAGDVLAGKVIVGPDGEPLTGTLALSGNASDGQVLNGQTYYNTDAKTKRTGTMPNRGAVNQSLAINGSYTIPAGYHNGSGKVTQNVPTKGAQTYTPGTTNQTIAANQYLTGPQTIKGDPNLKPENIKKGVSIMGITGTWEGYVTSPLYLYNKGMWNGLQTTGLTEINGEGSSRLDNDFSQSIGFYARSNFDEKVNARFNQKVDLTNYKYLKVHAIDIENGYLMIGISDNASAGISSYIASAKTADIGGYAILDISSLTGQKYIYIEANTANAIAKPSVNRVVECDQVMLSNT